MNFENDIFISYAHIDDQPLTKEQKGWISAFHESLDAFVAQYLGRKPKIWRDLKLQGNDDFSKELIEKLEKAAVLVTVLSPRYVDSKWCSKEICKFYEVVKQNGNHLVASKSRVFKVLKVPVKLEKQLPKELQALLGYEFYKLAPGSEKPREIRPEFGREAQAEYFTKVADLAYDIKALLETLKDDESAPEEHHVIYPQTTVPEKTIYLAETTADLSDERDKIKRELLQLNYTVLPDPSLPYTPDLTKLVQENLKRCTLSIHLIGERYGIIPEGASQSVVALQNELATVHSQENSGFSHLIWIPVGLQAQEPRQEEFIKFLQNDVGLLQTNLEELKTIIQDKLNPPQKILEPVVTEAGTGRQVYLIYDQRDCDVIEPLYEYLDSQKFSVIIPSLEGDETQVRQDHQDKLRQCDAVLIYWGNINELWLQRKLRDLQKIPGYGRSKPMLIQAIYISEPQTIQKQRIRVDNDVLVIENFEAFSPDLLKPFLAKIDQGKGGLG